MKNFVVVIDYNNYFIWVYPNFLNNYLDMGVFLLLLSYKGYCSEHVCSCFCFLFCLFYFFVCFVLFSGLVCFLKWKFLWNSGMKNLVSSLVLFNVGCGYLVQLEELYKAWSCVYRTIGILVLLLMQMYLQTSKEWLAACLLTLPTVFPLLFCSYQCCMKLCICFVMFVYSHLFLW